MASPSVHADWDHDILVNVEWRGNPLSNYVVDVVIRVGAVVEVGTMSLAIPAFEGLRKDRGHGQ